MVWSFLICHPGFSQNNDITSQEKYSIDITFEELHRLEAEASNLVDNEELNRIVNTHILKSKIENNPIELARAFYYKILTVNPEIALIYSDSIITVTEKSSHTSYPTLGYTLKANLLYEQGDFQKSLENYLKALELAIIKENKQDQQEISLAIAAIRNINGQHYAAATIYRSSLQELIQKPNYAEEAYEDYSTLLYNLSLTYLRLSQLDSAKYYTAKGLDLAASAKNEYDYRDFALVDAQINYYEKDYKRAKDSLQKYIGDLDGTSKAIKLYYLGKIEKILGNESSAINYFKEIDSIITSTNDPFGEVKDVYQQLIIDALLRDNQKEQINYIEKLIYYDSLLSTAREDVLNQAVLGYDIPDLKRQKRKAERQLRLRNIYAAIAAALALVAIISGLFYFQRARIMRKRLKLLMEPDQVSNFDLKSSIEDPPSIPADIRIQILENLKLFEESNGYLNKDMDLSLLATELGTNTTYLSTVINHFKNVNFPNYLKQLRIKAAVYRLSHEPDLLKYNYQGLAGIFGFKTGESFSKAFFQETGVSPSKFLKELKNRNQ